MKHSSWETARRWRWTWGSVAPLLLALRCVSAGRVRSPGSHVRALSKVSAQEDAGKHRLESWCQQALSAQTGRCAALQRLLEQAEQSKGSSVGQLEADAASVAEAAQHQRVSSNIQQREAKQKLVAAELQLEDAGKDVAVLQQVSEKFRWVKKYQDQLAPLLRRAKAEEQRLRQGAALIQEQESARASRASSGGGGSLHLEEDYAAKRKAISQALQQQVTTERSMEVLTAALQDESVYLADLQILCDLGAKAHEHLQSGPLMLLNQTLARLVFTLSSQAQQRRAEDSRAAERSPAKSLGAGVLARRPLAASESLPRVAKALRTLAATAKASGRTEVRGQSGVASPVPLLKMQSLDTNGILDEEQDQQESNSTAGSSTAAQQGTTTDSQLASHHPPPQRPQSEAHTSSRSQSQRRSHEALDHSNSDVDGDVNSGSRRNSSSFTQGESAEERRSPSQESQTALPPAIPQSTATEPAHADSDTPGKVASKSPLLTGRPRLQSEHKKKTSEDTSFMGGVYDSASGTMPAEYEAWTPDGSAGDQQRLQAPVNSSPTKRMMAMLGDTGHEPSATGDAKPAAPAATQKAQKRSRRGHKQTSQLSSEPAQRPQAGSTPRPVHVDLPQPAQQSQLAEGGSPEHRAVEHEQQLQQQSQPDFKSDEAIDKAFASTPEEDLDLVQPTKQSTGKKVERPVRKDRGSLMQKTLTGKRQRHRERLGKAGGDNLPAQYSAWNPDDEQVPTAKDASLEQLLSDFEHDDAVDAEEAAKTKRPRSKPSSSPSPPAKTDAEASVVYDDDDLPKHTATPISLDLRGGWRSFVNKGPSNGKAHKPKLDPDVAIMNNLYSSDGGLPQQYAAWKPSADDADVGSHEAASKAELGGVADTPAPVTLAQLSSVTLGLAPVARLVQHKDLARSLNKSSTSLANSLLEHYSQVLHSKTLGQLASAHLTKQKLAELWQKLQMVDPLEHPGAAIHSAKHQAQAVRWCQYFLRNEQAASPLRTAVAQLEKDQNSLAESTSQHAAITEEIEARQQLVRTMNEDVESLSTLLKASEKEDGTISSLRLSQEDLGLLQTADLGQLKELLAYNGALETYEMRHLEIMDLVEATLRRRVSTLKVQNDTLSQLHSDMLTADKAVGARQAQVSRSTDNVKSAQQHLEGVGASCSAALSTLQQHQHRGHLEAHAVELALKVLEAQ